MLPYLQLLLLPEKSRPGLWPQIGTAYKSLASNLLPLQLAESAAMRQADWSTLSRSLAREHTETCSAISGRSARLKTQM